MAKYKILQSTEIEDLQSQVEQHLKNDWQPVGSLSVVPVQQKWYNAPGGRAYSFREGFTYYQAVLKGK